MDKDASKTVSQDIRMYKTFILSVGLAVALSLSGIFFGISVTTRNLLYDEILGRARAHFRSLVLMRKWNAGYGGVYVEKKPGMTSNPYLENPDIKTCDGKVYTKKNPALMTREISEYSEKEGLIAFHMTSLMPLNPQNRPDAFEAKALQSFEKGAEERYQIEERHGRAFFRYIAPLYVEKECLQCHAKQGYKIGQVRGGISVTFDIEDLQKRLKKSWIAILLLGLLSIALLLGIIYLFTSRLITKVSEANRKIQEMAITDALTRIFNRRHIMERFAEEFERARRVKGPLSCIMADIDDFKSINDTYGHLFGDRILEKISAVMSSSLRAYDILGRFGGEEFLIVLPDTGPEAAGTLAERIRNNVKGQCTAEPGLSHCGTVTMSFGFTVMRDSDRSVDDMIKRADVGLYKAKTSGKDKTEIT
jgi:diguanylate cyclase (GGDEF)-like protein